ncbi:VOC family protein [Lysobacter enzymogenes]|uniref:VOC family protein n=1 Tax=Lysobacter enzymogenes TaxID=69 RepID=UPI002B3FFCD6|nr:VOC family protein [Lysobacter enzymogenes]
MESPASAGLFSCVVRLFRQIWLWRRRSEAEAGAAGARAAQAARRRSAAVGNARQRRRGRRIHRNLRQLRFVRDRHPRDPRRVVLIAHADPLRAAFDRPVLVRKARMRTGRRGHRLRPELPDERHVRRSRLGQIDTEQAIARPALAATQLDLLDPQAGEASAFRLVRKGVLVLPVRNQARRQGVLDEGLAPVRAGRQRIDRLLERSPRIGGRGGAASGPKRQAHAKREPGPPAAVAASAAVMHRHHVRSSSSVTRWRECIARFASGASRGRGRRSARCRCERRLVDWSPTSEVAAMALKRMDNVGIVVEDLDAAVEFFRELGLELEGRATVEGEWAGRITGLGDQRVEIAMMRTPDGHSRLELSRFIEPKVIADHRNAPVNALGYLRVMFAVDDLADTLERLRPHGAQVVGEVVDYQDVYRLCYIRGPEGILIGLAQELAPA